MKLTLVSVCAGVCAVSIVACSKNPSTPVSPSVTAQTALDAAGEEVTLKVTAPTLQSPVNGLRLEQAGNIALTIGSAAAKFDPTLVLSYRFQVHNANGVNIVNQMVPSGGSTTTYVIPFALDGDQNYSWRARVEIGDNAGPWTPNGSFYVPVNDGYIRGSELYDPLNNGKTVGTIVGPVTFIPGVGLRFHSQLSLVMYQLPQTLNEGEFSLLTSDMDKNTDGDKTKLFSMAQGFSDIVTNDRRMTVEKRGDPAGVVAWRFITHGDQVDTEGAEREEVNFVRSKTYFWQATWRANVFRVIVREGGADGPTIYNKAKPFQGRSYDPSPHVVYLGAPPGRSGESGASVDNVTYRQIWVSANPRPSFANR